jgi:hypothetical protein
LFPLLDDLVMCAGVLVEIASFVAMLVFFVFGKYWYIFALVAAVVLVLVEIKRPKKYVCSACKYKFVFRRNKGEQPNNVLHDDTKLRRG